MPVTNYVKGLKYGPSHIFIATPTYSGSTSSVYEMSIAETLPVMAAAKIGVDICYEVGNCHVDDARNSLVRQFLRTDCTDLVFIDADIGWSVEDLIKLVSYDRDLVAGIYPKKQDDEDFPVLFEPGIELYSEKDGLLEVNGAPTGFMRIKRHVLEKMVEAHKDRSFMGQGGQPGDEPYYPIFERLIEAGRRWSGDYAFCRKWKAMGGKIHTDPEMKFQHVGEKIWHGSLGNYLREKADLVSPLVLKSLERLKAGDESGEVFVDLCNGWNNPYSATPELLAAVYRRAKNTKGNILETGSGLTTLVAAAAGAKIMAFEHEHSWYFKIIRTLKAAGLNADIQYVRLKDYGDFIWYELPEVMPAEFEVVICDGPQRKYGRDGLFKLINPKGSCIIMDDISDPNMLATFKRWDADRPYHEMGEVRKFLYSEAA